MEKNTEYGRFLCVVVLGGVEANLQVVILNLKNLQLVEERLMENLMLRLIFKNCKSLLSRCIKNFHLFIFPAFFASFLRTIRSDLIHRSPPSITCGPLSWLAA